MFLFVLVYYARPSDWIPGASHFPFEKITGGIALLAFGLVIVQRGSKPLPSEIKVLLWLFAQFCLCIPFAIWRGGSFSLVFGDIAKIFLITAAMALSVTTLSRLHHLMLLQAIAMAAIAALSLHAKNYDSYHRLNGAVGGVFDNPNDLAFNLAIAVPLCFVFLATSRSLIKKGFWIASLGLLSYTIVLTSSRSGFLAMFAGAAAALWHFGVKGRRKGVLIFAGVAVFGILCMASSKQYYTRLSSIIFQNELDETGSIAARRELLIKSIEVTATHPLFGVGPGNFDEVSGNWHVSHNTYLQLSADAGIPALALFVVVLWCAFGKLNRLEGAKMNPSSLQHYVGGLKAALVGFVVGAFFADTAYHFFPYFLIAYASALFQIAKSTQLKTQGALATPELNPYDDAALAI